MTSIVSGASGFVGGHLARELLARDEVVILLDTEDRPAVRKLIEHPRARVVWGDLAYQYNWSAIPPAEHFYHLAGTVGSRHFLKEDALCRNAMIMSNLIEWARYHQSKIVFSSTNEVYHGAPTNLFPRQEEDEILFTKPFEPRWSYAFSKFYCEAMLHNSNVNFVIARLANVYGPDMVHRYVIKSMIERILEGENPLIMANPDDTRPFTYVQDTVEGLITLMEKGVAGETYNISTLGEYSILETAEMLVKVNDLDVQVERGEQGEVERRWPSSTKIRKLGWASEVELDDGLKRTYEWYAQG
jgi:nucleoside-diphosphate-sugar epimerase